MLHVTKNCVWLVLSNHNNFSLHVSFKTGYKMIVEKCQFSTSALWAKHMEIFNNYENSKTLETNANFEIMRS